MPNQSVTVSVAGAGTTTIIPGVAGQIIQVFGMVLVANVATTYQIKSGTTNLSGSITSSLGSTVVLPLGGDGDTVWLETGIGESLNLTITGLLGGLGGWILYKQFDV